MSQVRINLQPPPNVDFVTGYPGIPPGPDRPQAAVKGAVEIRVANAGVKAKWVRIELRKLETLPGGGPGNTYQDFVGPSPVNLWTSSDEYTVMRSQDFPFSIRIPESIPPSIALENRAGISYELVASICTKGKTGFLRKAKSTVASTVATIMIDKHDLHTTWPVYSQPETRHLAQDGVNLIVERTQNCFGPGDVISAYCTVKSDSQTVVLRGFEMVLKETTVYRPGMHSQTKKTMPPQTQVRSISEGKIPVNITLYGGSNHTSEVSCRLPEDHTTTTLNAARHIDVTYTLIIQAVMGTGNHLLMELPVIISNWQRPVSQTAMQQIGLAPSLSMRQGPTGVPPVPVAAPAITHVEPAVERRQTEATTMPTSVYSQARSPAAGYSTLPGSSDFGGGSSRQMVDEFGSAPRTLGGGSSSNPPVRQATAPAGRSLGITNAQPDEVPNNPVYRQTTVPAPAPGGSSSTGASSGRAGQGSQQGSSWQTAEAEKLELYEKARRQVIKLQGAAAAPPPVPAAIDPPVTSVPSRSATTTPPAPSGGSSKPWLTAEEEKSQLFHKAAAAVARTQGMDYTPPATVPPVSAYEQIRQTPEQQKFQGSSGSKPSPAAQLYAQAMGSQGRPGGSGSGSGSGSGFGGASSKPAYVSAEEEKIALKRYHEAREAANRKQPSMFEDSPPVPGATAGPAHSAGASVQGGSSFKPSQPPPFSDEPPPFDAGTKNAFEQLSEKERLRQEYARRDAMASGASSKAQTPPPAAYTAPPPAAYSAPPPAAYTAPPPEPAPLTPAVYRSAQEEKEAMRRKFAARDQAMSGGSAAASGLPSGAAPPRFNDAVPGYSPSPPASVAPPAPQRILTAAEEKAMLRAKYAAMEGGSKNNGTAAAPNPPPPPFTPRTNGSEIQPLAPRSQQQQQYTQDDGRKPEYGYPGAPPPAGSQGFSPPAPSRYQE